MSQAPTAFGPAATTGSLSTRFGHEPIDTDDQADPAEQVGTVALQAAGHRLADDGTVTRHTDYGKAGRPKTRYQWR